MPPFALRFAFIASRRHFRCLHYLLPFISPPLPQPHHFRYAFSLIDFAVTLSDISSISPF